MSPKLGRPQLDEFFVRVVEHVRQNSQWSKKPDWMRRASYTAFATAGCHFVFSGGSPIYFESTPSRQDPRRQPADNPRPPLDADVVRLKAASIRAGIEHCIPNAFYSEWVPLFLCKFPYYGWEVEVALSNILSQFNLLIPGRATSAKQINDCLHQAKTKKGRDENPRAIEEARVSLMMAKSRWDAIHYPDLAAAMVLYQASTFAYLRKLDHAISFSGMGAKRINWISFVIHHSLQPFRDFTIFTFVLNLAIQKRQEMSPANFPGATEANLREAAIGAAWKELFAANLFQSDFDSSSMICPAAPTHLRYAADTGIVEQCYRFIVQHRDDPAVEYLLSSTQAVIKAAMSPPRDYYYKYFLAGGSSLQALAQLGIGGLAWLSFNLGREKRHSLY